MAGPKGFRRIAAILAGMMVLTWGAIGSSAWAQDPYEPLRREMVRDQIAARGIVDGRVLAAMERIPRHLFVPPDLAGDAYDDRPLPIGRGQTISQPFIVAFMTEILKLTGGENVLEIGTGSGYQAAVLALTAGRVQTMEIVEPLAESARERLGSLGYPADVRAGDGYHGWPENAPYQAVIVTCAADHIPPPLIGQLAVGGRMIIPVGPAWGIQSLVLLEKESETSLKRSHLMAVRFVPLVTGR